MCDVETIICTGNSPMFTDVVGPMGPDELALRVCFELHVYVRGEPNCWVVTHAIAARLGLSDAKMDEAIEEGARQGWLEHAGSWLKHRRFHSIMLLEAGREAVMARVRPPRGTRARGGKRGR